MNPPPNQNLALSQAKLLRLYTFFFYFDFFFCFYFSLLIIIQPSPCFHYLAENAVFFVLFLFDLVFFYLYDS